MANIKAALNSGIWSGNEMFAMKKNISEEVKLNTKLDSFYREHSMSTQKLKKYVNSVSKSMREIKTSTGCSRKGLPIVQTASHSICSSQPVITYDVPENMILRSARSYDMRPRGSLLEEINLAVNKNCIQNTTNSRTSYRIDRRAIYSNGRDTNATMSTVESHEKITLIGNSRPKQINNELKSQSDEINLPNKKSNSQISQKNKDSSTNENPQSYRNNNHFPKSHSVNDHRTRTIKSNGYNASLQTGRSKDLRRTKSDGENIERICFGEKVFSNQKGVALPDISRTDSFFSTDTFDQALDHESTSDEEEKELARKVAYMNMKYNPWKIQNRNGNFYNALELPNIKDCHRRACRSTCATCMARKAKAPCFVIPGLTFAERSKLPFMGEQKADKSKFTKRETKKRLKSVKSREKQGTFSFSEENDNCNKKHETGSETRKSKSALSEASDTDTVVKEAVKYVVKNDRLVITKERLQELSIPKDGFRKLARISKASIRREITRLMDITEELAKKEQQNRRLLDSRIGMFVALLNQQNNPAAPIKMVDIPIRDDVMRVDISHVSSPDYGSGAHHTVQRIANEKRRNGKHVQFHLK